jgi:FAD binding domain
MQYTEKNTDRLGTVNHTGVGGLTLGGGFGWLSPRYGLTIDNLLSAELILADGTIVRVSDNEQPDLFWAIRGCGSSFAVCTEFVFQAYDQQNQVWGGLMAFSPDKIEGVVGFGNKFHQVATDQAFVIGVANPPPHFQTAVVTILYFNGPEDQAREFYADLINLGPIVEKTHMMPYEKLNSMLNPLTDYGGRKTMGSSAFKYPLDVGLVQDVFDNHVKLVTEHKEANGSIAMFWFVPHDKVLTVP